MRGSMLKDNCVNKSSANLTQEERNATVPYADYKYEMDLKNQAYCFIVALGLTDEFTEFVREDIGDYHTAIIMLLAEAVDEKKKVETA